MTTDVMFGDSFFEEHTKQYKEYLELEKKYKMLLSKYVELLKKYKIFEMPRKQIMIFVSLEGKKIILLCNGM